MSRLLTLLIVLARFCWQLPKPCIARLNATLDDLRTALGGDDREAGHARDVIRSLIERVTLTAIELDRIDKRGQGPVRVTVEGSRTR